jgi:hypothetical protein
MNKNDVRRITAPRSWKVAHLEVFSLAATTFVLAVPARSAAVTPDQAVEQTVMMNDSIHPSHAEAFDVTIMDRPTQKVRRLIHKVDQKTRDRKVEMDRSGQCTPVKPRAAR